MKYHLKDKKADVKSFKVDGSNLFYVSREGLYLNDTLVAKEVDQTNYSLYGRFMVYLKGEVTHFEEEKIDKAILIDSLDNDTALFSSNFNLDDFTLQYELIDLKDWSLVYDFGQLPIVKSVLREGYKICLHLEERLMSMNLSSNKVEWELKLNALKVVGLYQNQLYIACTNHRLMSIDINTGKIVLEWKELKGFEAGQEYKDVLPEPSDFVLDKVSGKLIGVFSKFYLEIDLESGEINYEDVREELQQYRINSFRRMGDNPFTNDHLFVTAHAELEERPNVDLDCVLALNRNTKKVDWVHVFKDTGLGTNVPQITDTHLYQLDAEGNLHIFEKE